MANIIKVSFKGAPPAQGGRQSDRVPEDRYLLKVAGSESAQNGDMVGAVVRLNIVQGEFAKKRLRDQFLWNPDNTEEKNFGLQRFHAFLLALGYKIPPAGVVSIDLDTLIGRQVIADVEDNTFTTRGANPRDVTTSQPVAYYPKPKAQTAANGAAPAQVAQEAVAAPPVVEEAPQAPVATLAPEPEADAALAAPDADEEDEEDTSPAAVDRLFS